MLRVKITIHGTSKIIETLMDRRIPSHYANPDERGLLYTSRFRPIIFQALEEEGLYNEYLFIEDIRGIYAKHGNKIFVVIDDEGGIIKKLEVRKRLAKVIAERFFMLTNTATQCIIHPTSPDVGLSQIEELAN